MIIFDDPPRLLHLIRNVPMGKKYYEDRNEFFYTSDGVEYPVEVIFSDYMKIQCECEDGVTRWHPRRYLGFYIPGILRFDAHFDGPLIGWPPEGDYIDYSGYASESLALLHGTTEEEAEHHMMMFVLSAEKTDA